MTNGAAKQYPEEQEQFNENISHVNVEPHLPTQKYFLSAPGNVSISLGMNLSATGMVATDHIALVRLQPTVGEARLHGRA